MTQPRTITTCLLSLIFLISFFSIPTAEAQEESTTVQMILFYSPSCGHCHYVITEVLPPLIEQYGNQLQLFYINTQSQEGQALYQAAIETFDISEERKGVPTLIIGDTILVGSGEIPEFLPQMIEDGLGEGGISWPSIPGLEESIETAIAQATEQAQATQTAEAASTETPSPTTEAATPTENAAPSDTQEPTSTATAASSSTTIGLDDSFPQERSMMVKFKRDPVANSFAVALLGVMIVSVIIIWVQLLQRKPPNFSWPAWVIPALSFVGIFVAVYLSYVEISQTEAVCGPVGDCNTVQQSPYARLFGFLPVGVLGLGGYIAIIASWLVYRFGPRKWLFLSIQALWGMAFFGTLFSIYLTFLEPFVIGASCAWCLTSALLMTLLLWVSTNDLRHALGEDSEMGLDHA